MEMTTVPLRVPEAITPFLNDLDKDATFKMCAMLLYPFIQDLTISHGRAAELLGVHKRDLIEYYNSIGLSYLDQSKDDLLQELAAFDKFMEKSV